MLKLAQITIDWISQKCDVHIPSSNHQQQTNNQLAVNAALWVDYFQTEEHLNICISVQNII